MIADFDETFFFDESGFDESGFYRVMWIDAQQGQ